MQALEKLNTDKTQALERSNNENKKYLDTDRQIQSRTYQTTEEKWSKTITKPILLYIVTTQE